MSGAALLAAAAVGLGVAGLARGLHPPTPRLAPRLAPYTTSARVALGRPLAGRTGDGTGTIPKLFGPPSRALLSRLARAADGQSDERLARRLRQAGRRDTTPEQFRVRRIVLGTAVGAVAACGVGILTRSPGLALGAGAAGAIWGGARERRSLDRAVAARADRIRLELYTVNHLLAMHVRTGAGGMQAVQRVVARGSGAVVEELADVLTWIRSGAGEVDAFRRAAEETPEPGAARTYRLLAAGIERGVDLGEGLLAMSADLRDARREQLQKEAVKRRATMLVPTIAILAPVMLLFIAAPLPSIVLGSQ
ncbi:MAG: type II secretion system F family protein [Actinomycetota bacterium]